LRGVGDGLPFQGAALPAGRGTGRQDLHPGMAGSQVQIVETVAGHAEGLVIQVHRRADAQAAVAHVGEDVDPLHPVEGGDLHVHLDIGKHPARGGQAPDPRGGQVMPDEIEDALLQDPLGHGGELLRGIAPEDLPEFPVQGRGAVAGDDVPVRRGDQVHEGVFLVGDGIGVVGQGHDLSLILQLPHVHEVGDVFEEDPQRGMGGKSPEELQTSPGKAADGAAEAVADAVEGDHQGLGKAAARRGGHRMGGVVVHEGEAEVPEAQGAQTPGEMAAAQGDGNGIGGQLGEPVLEGLLEGIGGAGGQLPAADEVVFLLEAGEEAGQGLGRIRRRGGDVFHVRRGETGELQTGADGEAGEAHL